MLELEEERGKENALDLENIKNHDLVDYLATLGFQPKHIRGINYWYLSPLRIERTASFKVNRKINRWYDHGLGKGGTLIDFGMLYFQCDSKDFLSRWELSNFSNIGIVQPQRIYKEEEPKLIIKSVKDLTSPSLFNYLKSRGISTEFGKQFCKQVSYELGDKSYYGLGFKNDSGGYELRNPFYKYASSPKDITSMIQGFSEVKVFEGFMDFLSYLTFQPLSIKENDFVILNGLAFLEKAKLILDKHEHIHLYLDRDASGKRATQSAIASDKRFKDESKLYHQHKDFNEWWVKVNKNELKNDRKLRLK